MPDTTADAATAATPFNRPSWFELYSPDPAATNAFLADVFGWKAAPFPGPMDYHLLDTGDAPGGIHGGVCAPPRGMPAGATVNIVTVEDLEATLARVAAAGGAVAVPKMPVPTIGWCAYATDPAGVLLGLMQPDPNAA
jgi:predicted enzyme related to lactoylglutathione lyase